MRTVIIVDINEDMKVRARNCSNIILSRLPPRPNYTGVEYPDRYYNGYLGEFAFEELLKVRGKNGIHNITLNGASQGEDFACIFPIGEKKIDIKTTAYPYSTGMNFPKVQYHDQGYIYVGIKLRDDYAAIMGWCWYHEMNKHPEDARQFPVPTNYIRYTEMNDIGGLIDKMNDGNVVTNLYK
jgi:hypothetical protein